MVAVPVLILMGAFLSTFGHYRVPSGAMSPNLIPGDHIHATKKLPFTRARMPDRGDIVVFNAARGPGETIVFVSRVIGLPGDIVQLKKGRLHINNQIVERNFVEKRTVQTASKTNIEVSVYTEHLPGSIDPVTIYEISDREIFDFTEKFTVPSDHLFMIGDHRDKSADSRMRVTVQSELGGYGTIPMDAVIGKVKRILWSVPNCEFHLGDEDLYCPSPRFFESI